MRLAESYQATSDAMVRVLSRVLSKRPPRIRDPWYLEPEKGSVRARGLTPETGLDDAIFRLAKRTGRSVGVGPTGGVLIGDAPRRVH